MSFNHDARPEISRGFRLQWEAAQDAHVMLYPEGMIKLNASAAEILRRCDGTRTVEEIAAELQSLVGNAAVTEEVLDFIAAAIARGWLVVQ